MEVINIKNVCKVIDKNLILNNINLTIAEGEICGIIGRNASGKSMLLKTICGFATYRGDIEVFGKALSDSEEYIGCLIEYPGFLPQYSGLKNLRLLSSIRGKIEIEQIKETMVSVGLDPDDKKKYRKYSLGMRQKLGIACAIMEHPRILILDEPTNNLDLESAKNVCELLCNLNIEYKTTIIVTSHNKQEIDTLCNSVYRIENGEIMQKRSIESE